MTESTEGPATVPGRSKPADGADVARLAGGSAALLFVRRVLLQIVSAGSTALVARQVGVVHFGVLASAQGLIGIFTALVDFGFSLVVARELARHPRPGQWLGAAVKAEGILGLFLGVVLLILALASGLGSQRGALILILMPAVAVSGLIPLRQIFLVHYRIRLLAKIDITTNLTQSALTIAVALAGLGVEAVAAVACVTSIANTLWVAAAGRRHSPLEPPEHADMMELLRAALPIGLVSFMASVYMILDLAILPYLVPAAAVGQYGAACKFLNLLATVPGLVMTAALPGMASLRDRADQLGELAARIAHWLMAFALPACVGAIVFAPAIVKLFFGPGYAGSIPLLRILSIAAALTGLSALLGTLLTSQAVVRNQLIQNGVAISFNLVGNVLLAPTYGPSASAWLTVLTEVIVDCGSLIALRGRLHLGPAARAGARPLLACLVLPVASWAFSGSSIVGLVVGGVGYVIVLVAIRGWPAEFVPPRLRRERSRLGL